MTDDGYNGWPNHETWLVNLWLNNDESSYHFWRQRAADLRAAAPDSEPVKAGIWSVERAAVSALADELKESIEESASDALPEPNMLSDLLGSALSRVNWHEIACYIQPAC